MNVHKHSAINALPALIFNFLIQLVSLYCSTKILAAKFKQITGSRCCSYCANIFVVNLKDTVNWPFNERHLLQSLYKVI